MRGFEHDMERVYAYLASFIDADGTLIITKQKRPENRSGCRFIPVIAITNTNKEVLQFFIEKTGYGRIHDKKETGKERYGWKTQKNCYVWQIKHSQAKEVLEKLLPYFVIKRKQAENMLELLDIFGDVAYNYITQSDLDIQFNYYIKSKELNGTVLTDEEKEKLRPTLRSYKNEQGGCSVEDCVLPHYGKGLCRVHWKRKYYEEVLKEKKPWHKAEELAA